MNRLFYLTFTLVIGSCISSCYYDNELDLYGNDTRCQDYTPTFSGGVSEILIRECFQCHTNKLQLGQVTLEGYENVMPYANNGSLVGSIEHASGFSPMPKDRSKLSFCEIEIVKEWIAAGALDN